MEQIDHGGGGAGENSGCNNSKVASNGALVNKEETTLQLTRMSDGAVLRPSTILANTLQNF